uniref:Peptidase A1 domain-containing protein n=1 Tax=Chromera velia CCMP2878 TaxID=1169474 RepID=A0A0G4HBS5_9ALVE|eukprot:Cvel_6235.t1-p1 / transcript=Cvel_6235.t1 / gene=Cvel_6235 / organism=Chromera_velia_CCMP2878 / gene_product=Protein ASPARTIC PROTEASE IN GUARD CELL 1, putative / transcript_product=Protein ASPARTIC PROTEASE IN GUARD CELL 1, putative / location=Cvel_scaffold302:1889-3803(-) / protein_length=511 / sequence_SO=supercontig / SO=protein_coding / is_pseudo=false
MWWLPLLFGAVLASLPVCEASDEASVEHSRVFGNIHSYGYYFADILVGTPFQRQSVILDTGSAMTAFPCASCESCGTVKLDPFFNSSMSSTFYWHGCGMQTEEEETVDSSEWSCSCGQADTTRVCTYGVSYVEGSSIAGKWFSDVAIVASQPDGRQASRHSLGCHTRETNLFLTQKANGIMGVASPRASSRGQMEVPGVATTLFDRSDEDRDILSICLAEFGGSMSVGGFNASRHETDISSGPGRNWTPLIHPRRYYVRSTGMKGPGGADMGVPGVLLLDSGTTYSYLRRSTYTRFRDLVNAHCESDSRCSARMIGGDLCYDLPSPDVVSEFPKVTLEFLGNVTVEWEPRSYLYRRGTRNVFCFGVANAGWGTAVLGQTFFVGRDVVFERFFSSGPLEAAEAVEPSWDASGVPEGRWDRVAMPSADCPTVRLSDRPDLNEERLSGENEAAMRQIGSLNLRGSSFALDGEGEVAFGEREKENGGRRGDRAVRLKQMDVLQVVELEDDEGDWE